MKTRELTTESPDYPEGMTLLPLMDPDPAWRARALYLRGSLPRTPGVAVVGTRHPTEEALRCARELVGAIAELGCSVWSGGAIGIDAMAHQTALSAEVTTVAVTAGGLDDAYPPQHAPLYQRVRAAGGALVSLQADGAVRHRYQFLERNRVLAALTLATLVVQAPLRSGARSTARAARKLGKPLLVVPAEPWSVKGAGCALELAAGAIAVSGARQLRRLLEPLVQRYLAGRSLRVPLLPHPTVAPASTAVATASGATSSPGPADGRGEDAAALGPLDEDQQRVLAALDRGPGHADGVCSATGLSAARVSRALMILRLGGLVVEVCPGSYRRGA